jgi:proton glutamate symport protein
MANEKKPDRLLSMDLLLNPWVVIISMILGIYIGVYYKRIAIQLSPFGNMYVSLLKMCVLPILLSAVAYSLGGLLKAHTAKTYLKRMLVVFTVTLVLTCLLGLASGIIGRPGIGINEDILGKIINDSPQRPDMEIFFFQPNDPHERIPGLLKFFVSTIPPNIFYSLTNDRNLQVLLFAIIIGFAVGMISTKHSESLLILLDAIFNLFSKIIRWIIYALPFGLFCLMADLISQIGMDILLSMIKFIIVFHVCAVLVVIINTLVIWYRSGSSFTHVLSALKEPVILALGTRNGFATLPSALDALHEKLNFDQTSTNLLVPLGLTICRYGNVLYFAIATIFITQLYNTSLGLPGMAMALIGTIFAGMATSGATGVVILSMLAIVLQPLKLPLEAVLILFIAIDPIVEPMRTLITVHSSCSAASLIAHRPETPAHPARTNDDEILDETEDLQIAPPAGSNIW